MVNFGFPSVGSRGTAFIAALMCSSTLHAQNGAVAPAPVQTASTAHGAAPDGDIVVTATRRSESIQSVPLSITAIDQASLQKRAATGFFDYATAIPNFSFGNTGEGTTNRTIAIRGISDRDTTGFYIDDTPVPSTIDPKIVDVSRIEVLRGPQGTLFGARSMGGTVRMITEQPDATKFSGRIHSSLSTTSNTDRPNYQIDGAINIPVIAETLAIRVAGIRQYDAGYFKRKITSSGDTTDNIARSATSGGSIAVKWTPTPALTITPRLLYQKTRFNGLPFADVAIDPDAATSVTLRPDSLTQVRDYDVGEGSLDRWLLATNDIHLRQDFGTFTSSTSFFWRYTDTVEDETGPISALLGTPEIPASIEDKGRNRNFTEEVRFASSFKGPFQVVIGTYYNRARTTGVFPANYIDGLDASAGGAFGTDLVFSSSVNTLQTELAGYAEGTYDLSSKLRAIAGVRGFQVKTSSSAASDGIAAGGLNVTPHTTQKESGVNPRFSLQYRFNPHNQVYVTAAKGYRPGGVNGALPDAFGCSEDLAALGIDRSNTTYYKSDSVWSYEAGVKSTLVDHRVTANVSAFRIDWNNIQQNVQLQCGFGFRGNAGKARSQGAEMELGLHLIKGLSLGFGFGYTDAKFTETVAGSKYVDGDRIPQVPRYTANIDADYSRPISETVTGFGHIDFRYVGDSTSGVNAPTDAEGRIIPRIRPAYELVNFRAGVDIRSLELAIFVKNLLNKKANLSDALSVSVEQIGRPRVTVNQPRTVGLEFVERF